MSTIDGSVVQKNGRKARVISTAYCQTAEQWMLLVDFEGRLQNWHAEGCITVATPRPPLPPPTGYVSADGVYHTPPQTTHKHTGGQCADCDRTR